MTLTPKELSEIRRGNLLRVAHRRRMGAEVSADLAVVVSSDAVNEELNTLVVAATELLGTRDRGERPHEVYVLAADAGYTQDIAVQTTQLWTIDRTKRVVEILGELRSDAMLQISMRMFSVLGGI